MSISATSITSNVLLAIGPPFQTGGKAAPSRWPGPPRHACHPHGELRDRGGELRDRYPLRTGELHDRRHVRLIEVDTAQGAQHSDVLLTAARMERIALQQRKRFPSAIAQNDWDLVNKFRFI